MLQSFSFLRIASKEREEVIFVLSIKPHCVVCFFFFLVKFRSLLLLKKSVFIIVLLKYSFLSPNLLNSPVQNKSKSHHLKKKLKLKLNHFKKSN